MGLPLELLRPHGQAALGCRFMAGDRKNACGRLCAKKCTHACRSVYDVDVHVNNVRMSKTTSATPITYSISDLAQEFDLTTRAIRFYEDMGLLQPTRQGAGGRTRVYSPRDRTRLRLILRGKRLGLSLTEAKEIIDLYDSPRDTAVQLSKFLEVLGKHRQQMEERLEDLQATLEEVRAQEKEAKSLLRKLQKTKAA